MCCARLDGLHSNPCEPTGVLPAKTAMDRRRLCMGHFDPGQIFADTSFGALGFPPHSQGTTGEKSQSLPKSTTQLFEGEHLKVNTQRLSQDCPIEPYPLNHTRGKSSQYGCSRYPDVSVEMLQPNVEGDPRRGGGGRRNTVTGDDETPRDGNLDRNNGRQRHLAG